MVFHHVTIGVIGVVLIPLLTPSLFYLTQSKLDKTNGAMKTTGNFIGPPSDALHNVTHPSLESCFSSLAFKSSPFQVVTAFSTFPFGCAYSGLVVQCANCHSVETFLNFPLPNSGPLLLISTSGMPCWANCTLN